MTTSNQLPRYPRYISPGMGEKATNETPEATNMTSVAQTTEGKRCMRRDRTDEKIQKNQGKLSITRQYGAKSKTRWRSWYPSITRISRETVNCGAVIGTEGQPFDDNWENIFMSHMRHDVDDIMKLGIFARNAHPSRRK